MAKPPTDPSLLKVSDSTTESKTKSEDAKLTAGRKYVGDFELGYEGATIDEQIDGNGFTLHQRLEILQYYYFETYGNKGRNIVVANIGFVISDQTDTAGVPIKRFVSFPIDDADKLIVPAMSGQRHSEDALSDYLKDLNTVNNITRKLKTLYQSKINKLYSIVIDLNSTREVCGHCDNTLSDLQDPEKPFLKNLCALLPYYGIMRGDDGNLILKVSIRASGFLDANFFNSGIRAPEVCREFLKDVKSHDPKTLLHLAPQNSRRYTELGALFARNYSTTYVGTPNADGESLQNLRVLHESIKIRYLNAEDNITLPLQTGFKSNFSQREGMVTRAKGLKQELSFSFNELARLNLHQIWHDWSIIEKEFAFLSDSLPPQGLTVIKSYLYGDPAKTTGTSVTETALSMSNLSLEDSAPNSNSSSSSVISEKSKKGL